MHRVLSGSLAGEGREYVALVVPRIQTGMNFRTKVHAHLYLKRAGKHCQMQGLGYICCLNASPLFWMAAKPNSTENSRKVL